MGNSIVQDVESCNVDRNETDQENFDDSPAARRIKASTSHAASRMFARSPDGATIRRPSCARIP